MPSRVLVVDDDSDMRHAIQEVLLDHGLSVALAADGREALEHADSAEPQLVILDITLPIIDGPGVADGLQARYGGTVPILAITADGRAAQKARRVGAYAFLRKPFELDDLVRLVQRGLAAAG